jgi:SpoVK/Ycf46/Vps4 family AAA+-type ATPase
MERNIRNAKVSSPCVLVFDDLDSLARSRGSGVKDITDNKGVLSQTLTENGRFRNCRIYCNPYTNISNLIHTF